MYAQATPPIDRLQILMGLWIKAAQQAYLAQISGQPDDAVARFVVNARKNHCTDEEIIHVQRQVPHTLQERRLKLGAEYRATYPDITAFYARMGVWALQEELDFVHQQLAPMMEAQRSVQNFSSQAPAPVAPTPAPSIVPPVTSPPMSKAIEIQPSDLFAGDIVTTTPTPLVVHEMDPTGERIHSLLERIFKVRFLFRGRSDGNGRITEYRYVQDLDAKTENGKPYEIIPFEMIESRFPSILKMHGGLESGKNPILLLDYNHFSIQVPKRGWSRDRDAVLVEEVIPFERTRFVNPGDPVQLPIGKTLRGLPLWWEPSRRGHDHASVVGSTGGGKNSIIDAVCYGLMRRYPPHLAQLLLCDTQDGMNLSEYRGMPWLWEQDGRIIASPEDIEEAIAAVVQEMRNRESSLSGNARNINDFNQRYPNDAMYRLFFVFDEIKIARDRSSSKKMFDQGLAEIACGGGKLGIHLLACTQRNAANHDGVFTPDLRDNLSVRFAVKTASENQSKMAFGNNFVDAYRLCGEGDAFAFMPGMDTPERIQVYWTDPSVIQRYKDAIHSSRKFQDNLLPLRPIRPVALPEQNRKGGSEDSDFFADADAASTPRLRLVSANPDAELEQIKQAIADLLAEGTSAAEISARMVLIKLWGRTADSGRASNGNRIKLSKILARNGYQEDDLSDAIKMLVNEAVQAS